MYNSLYIIPKLQALNKQALSYRKPIVVLRITCIYFW